MFCPKCGAELIEGAVFCQQCACPINAPGEQSAECKKPTSAAPTAAAEPAVSTPVPAAPVTLEEYCTANPGWLQELAEGSIEFYRAKSLFGVNDTGDMVSRTHYIASENDLRETLTVDENIMSSALNVMGTFYLKRAFKKSANEHPAICYSYLFPAKLERITGIPGITVTSTLVDEQGHSFFTATWNRRGLVHAG